MTFPYNLLFFLQRSMKESDKQHQKTLVEIHWQPRYTIVDGIMRAHVPLDRDERRRFHRVSEVEGPR